MLKYQHPSIAFFVAVKEDLTDTTSSQLVRVQSICCIQVMGSETGTPHLQKP